MTQKLSPYKVSKMLGLYFQGYSQSAIANKLKINQATVSIYVNKFKASAAQDGLETAGETKYDEGGTGNYCGAKKAGQ